MLNKDKFKVGGINYKVRYKDTVEYADDKNNFGLCNYKKNEIHILNVLEEQRKEQVLVHELTHAIFNESGYTEQDEEMVERVSIVLHQFIKDNF